MKHLTFLLMLFLMPGMALAQSETEYLEFGGDLYGGGEQVSSTAGGLGDVFLAGQDSTLGGAIAGSAHMVGQNVSITQDVADNVYAAGQVVDVSGKVGGNASLMGQTITAGQIGRNLRAAGQTVTVSGPVSGSALIAAQTAKINAPISGDLSVNGQNIQFGTGATVGGTLTIYHSDPDNVDVPASVATADRIERKTVEDWSAEAPSAIPVSRRSVWRGIISTVILVTVLAAILAALMPVGLSRMRKAFLARPLRSFWIGFLALSCAIGATVVLAISVIGLLASPLAILLAVIAGFAGYIVGAYALGVWLLRLIGRAEPTAWIERAIAAGIGAVAIAVVGLLPFLGWLIVLVVTLMGLGALCVTLFRPQFYATDMTGPAG